ncbi:hypothetical protein FOA52_016092 [Chlamydomonas sp. UWO 241]|nr:hypothetical protein FOA52_016092 [Chlamydomonas sp. UWO 241]
MQLARHLLAACRDGDVDACVQVLSSSGAEQALARAVDEESPHVGWTALMWAAKIGHLELMRMLLNHPIAAPAEMMTVANNYGQTALMLAACFDQVYAMQVLLEHLSANAVAMLVRTERAGRNAFLSAASGGAAGALRLLLDRPSADPAAMLRTTSWNGATTIIWAAESGNVDAVHLLLEHPSADPAFMLRCTDLTVGLSALMATALVGQVDSMRMLFEHPSANPSAMMMVTDCFGSTAFTLAVSSGHVGAMRLLLEHPSAVPASMLTHTDGEGATALMLAARGGHVGAIRLLLGHPSADPTAMVAANGTDGESMLVSAARFATRRRVESASAPMRPCEPLLLLLHHVAEDPPPRDAQQAHMTQVLEALCEVQVEDSNEVDEEHSGHVTYFWCVFDDTVHEARDGCVRMLLERGADVFAPGVANSRRVVARVVRECVQLAGVPRLIPQAIAGTAGAWKSPLLGQPSADPTATVAADGTDGESMLVSAVRFAAGRRVATPTSPMRSCMPLLLLLRHVIEDPPPRNAQQAHMTQVLEALCEEEVEESEMESEEESGVDEERGGHWTRSWCLFDNHEPHDARDGCVRQLLGRGANVLTPSVTNSRRVVARLVRECVQLAGAPRLIHDAVVGLVGAPKRPRDDE